MERNKDFIFSEFEAIIRNFLTREKFAINFAFYSEIFSNWCYCYISKIYDQSYFVSDIICYVFEQTNHIVFFFILSELKR